MNKHERARIILDGFEYELEDSIFIEDYLDECQTTEKELEELKRDVKRYFEIDKLIIPKSMEDWHEQIKLLNKLTKVGEEK